MQKVIVRNGTRWTWRDGRYCAADGKRFRSKADWLRCHGYFEEAQKSPAR